MSKYEPLGDYLKNQKASRVTMSFSEIACIIGEPLPPSARAHSAWWANDPKHVEAAAWLNAGWKSASVSLMEERVVFFRD